MTQRHRILNGRMMFITTGTNHRSPVFEHPPYALEAVETLYRAKNLHPFSLYGFVVMCDHCHLLLRVEAPDTIARVMNVWKGVTSANIGFGRLWQARYHMSLPQDPWAALQYIHGNPVQAGYCKSPEEYPWSSANTRWHVDPLPT